MANNLLACTSGILASRVGSSRQVASAAQMVMKVSLAEGLPLVAAWNIASQAAG